MTNQYQPFNFEGRMCPAIEQLGHTLKNDPESRPWLIRAAIGDGPLSEEIANLATEWCLSADPNERRLGLLLGDRLGLKPVARQVALDLDERPEHWLGHPGIHGETPTLAQDAVIFTIRVSSPGSPALAQALRFALAQSETRLLGWNGLPPEQLADALPWIHSLLRQAPDLANQVASRFALLARDQCPALCSALVEADQTVRETIAETLEKNLKRMGKVRLWKTCRDALTPADKN